MPTCHPKCDSTVWVYLWLNCIFSNVNSSFYTVWCLSIWLFCVFVCVCVRAFMHITMLKCVCVGWGLLVPNVQADVIQKHVNKVFWNTNFSPDCVSSVDKLELGSTCSDWLKFTPSSYIQCLFHSQTSCDWRRKKETLWSQLIKTWRDHI